MNKIIQENADPKLLQSAAKIAGHSSLNQVFVKDGLSLKILVQFL